MRYLLACKVCNKGFYVTPSRFRKAKYCSIPCSREDIAKSMTGSLHPNWKGGTSDRVAGVSKWKREVIERDKCCQRCGATDRLHAHHIESYKEAPEKRLDLTNGVTLCNDCHADVHSDLSRAFVSHRGTSLPLQQCLLCQRDFKPRKKVQKYCSYTCLGKSKIKLITVQCVVCQEVFICKSNGKEGRKCCSPKCANKWSQLSRPRAKRLTFTCQTCGILFSRTERQASRRAVSYCSGLCRNKGIAQERWQRKRRKEST